MVVNKFGYKLNYCIEFVGCGFQEHYSTTFENGYEVSIIRSLYSYGGENGLYEVAVLNKNKRFIYSKFDTHDVLGFLNYNEVEQTLNNIKNFKSP